MTSTLAVTERLADVRADDLIVGDLATGRAVGCDVVADATGSPVRLGDGVARSLLNLVLDSGATALGPGSLRAGLGAVSSEAAESRIRNREPVDGEPCFSD